MSRIVLLAPETKTMDNSNKDLYQQIKNMEEKVENLQKENQQILKELNSLKYEKKDGEGMVEGLPDEVLFQMLNQLCDDDLLDNEFFAAVDELGKEKQKNNVAEDDALNNIDQKRMSLQLNSTECYNEFISHQSFYVGLSAEQIKIMIENNMVLTNDGPISKNNELELTKFLEECYLRDFGGTISAENFALINIFNFICEDLEIDPFGAQEVVDFCINQLRDTNSELYCQTLNDIVQRINFMLKQK